LQNFDKTQKVVESVSEANLSSHPYFTSDVNPSIRHLEIMILPACLDVCSYAQKAMKISAVACAILRSFRRRRRRQQHRRREGVVVGSTSLDRTSSMFLPRIKPYNAPSGIRVVVVVSTKGIPLSTITVRRISSVVVPERIFHRRRFFTPTS